MHVLCSVLRVFDIGMMSAETPKLGLTGHFYGSLRFTELPYLVYLLIVLGGLAFKMLASNSSLISVAFVVPGTTKRERQNYQTTRTPTQLQPYIALSLTLLLFIIFNPLLNPNPNPIS